MTLKKIQEIVKENQWKEEEGKLSLLILDYFKNCYLLSQKVYDRKLYSISIYATVKGYGFEWVRADEARQTLEWALKEYQGNKNYFQQKEKEFLTISQEITSFAKKVRKGIGNFSKEQLKNLIGEVSRLGEAMYGYTLISEGLDTFTQDDYHQICPQVPAKDLLKVVNLLGMPDEFSVVKQERLGLLKIARGSLRRGVKKNLAQVRYFNKLLADHTEQYHWMQNSFYRPIFLDVKYFQQELEIITREKKLADVKKEIKNFETKARRLRTQRKQLLNQYAFKLEAKIFFAFVRRYSFLQDQRKTNVQKLIFCIGVIINLISQRFRVDAAILNDGYFVTDLVKLINSGKKVSQPDLKKRKDIVAIATMDKRQLKTQWFFDQQARAIFEVFQNTKKHLIQQGVVKGFVASFGKGKTIIKGKVRIVFDPQKDEFRAGEILVTGMTRPEFVPIMKKAKAVITNEGGITTHAAIISRELGIPCVIGTKIATKVFKDNDLVEIDISQGTIRNISPKIVSD